jgi:DNA ligase D-like protein (predicted polymerase)
VAATKERVEIDGRALSLSNRDKVLWPQDGYTKGDLVAYYRAVAPYILPHLIDRPLTLQRYPDGIDGGSFFEKNASKYLPDWIPTVTVASEAGKRDRIRFIRCNDEATLVYVANLAAIVLHVWTSREPALDVPEFLFFDLDPFDGCTVPTLAKVALALRDALGEIGLETAVKTSGGSGLHVAIPSLPSIRTTSVRGSRRSSRAPFTRAYRNSRRSSACPRSGRRRPSISTTCKSAAARRSSHRSASAHARAPRSRCRWIGARSSRSPANGRAARHWRRGPRESSRAGR